jgi:soluble lytic murein transglycosylase
MRYVVGIAAIAFAVAAAVTWVVRTQPDWYLRERYPLSYEQIIRIHAQEHGLDPALLAAVVYVESRFNPDARSDAGAIGLMQLLPETAHGIAVRTGGSRFVVADLRDPDVNVRYGSWYLGHLVARYRSVELALAAYHAGEGNVDRWRRERSGIVFPETRAYVAKVERIRRLYAKAYGSELDQ